MGITSSCDKHSFEKRPLKKKLFKKAAKNNTVASLADSSCSQQSILAQKYRYIHGRKHHEDEQIGYVLPSDDDEADRMHQQHWILKYIFGSNFQAPVHDQLENGITVLDSACGPATWTLEMAKVYPNSTFEGVDISPLFPENIKPQNTSFHLGNIAKRLPFEDNTFDYIHQRLVFIGLTKTEWENNLLELYRILKPGGQIELVEPVIELDNCGPLTKKNQEALNSVMLSRDMCPNIGKELEKNLLFAGFENITVFSKKLPINHGGKAGELWWQDFKHLSLNLRPVMAQKNPEFEDAEQFEAYLDKSAEECKQYQTFSSWFINYGTKPMV
ncbi:S-adenosyl-L-methionine-dependent methyltransferase [Sporodiniella umbellata]|nr:S-adenosyl-L-methionine-dependent methyltransferase [Sporodiniella umbellata]